MSTQPGSALEGPCLVTGASGFIGGRIAARLARAGHEVRCLVRASSDTSALAGLDVELAAGDLTDPSSLRNAATGCTTLVHCAALVTDWATPAEIRAVNVVGTRSVMDAAAQAAVARVVHISSTDVYGHPGTAAVAEDHVPRRFSNWYSRTKLEAEAVVRAVARGHGTDAVVLRPATVYGPGSREVVAEIARALQGGHMLLVGGGRSVAGLCFVENVVDAVLVALAHPRAAGGAFNVTDGLDVTWRTFVDDLADGLGCPRARLSLPYPLALALGRGLEGGYRVLRRATGVTAPALLSRQAVDVLGRDQDFSNARIRELLGWTPGVDYRQGLAQTLAWLQSEHG